MLTTISMSAIATNGVVPGKCSVILLISGKERCCKLLTWFIPDTFG